MIYKQFKDLDLSALGFGTMRLPIRDGDLSKIDEGKAAVMIDYAMAHGVNYYDTGYGYHNGRSEEVLGRIMSHYPRGSFFLSDKFPGYDLENMDRVEEIFEEQLKRCGVEYFDFYFFHNVCELNIEEYLNEAHGIHKYLTAQRDAGRIRHLGFSAHGGLDVLKRFLEAYGDDLEFGMIQLNYLDYTLQEARAKIRLLEEYGIPVWCMEPLRGGSLASLQEPHEKALKALRPHESVPGWAFRFLQGLDCVKMTLSGMSSLEQVRKNIEIFESLEALSETELEALLGIARQIIDRSSVPCTGCNYCVSYCPQGLDIPRLLALYNEHSVTGGGFIAPMALGALPRDKRPKNCAACGACEAVCPQQIEISVAMADFVTKLRR